MAKIVINGSPGSFYAKNGNVLTKAALYVSETMTVEMTEKWVGLSEDILPLHQCVAGPTLAQGLLQADWPYSFRQPPLIVDTPGKVPMHVNTYFANILRCERKILARIEYDVDDQSIRCEENAVNLISNVKDTSSAAEWWQYALTFIPDNMTKELGMWKEFPGIADGAADGLFVGKHFEVANGLKYTNQGKIVFAGAPGSGKTLFRTPVVE